MNALVVTADGKFKQVKNLGWLLKHWQDVEMFLVKEPTFMEKYLLSEHEGWEPDAILTAIMKDGVRYITTYADKGILEGWLARPVFIGCPVNWFGTETMIHRDFAQKITKPEYLITIPEPEGYSNETIHLH